MAHVRSIVHSPVRDQDKPFQIQIVYRIPQGSPERQMIQRISGKHFY